MRKLRFAALFLALLTSLPGVGSAEEWPSRRITFIVPFPAGGSTDIAARVVGDRLSKSLGQEVVIVNKAGANGNIGIEYVAHSAADGYTILVGTDAVSANPHVYKMSFDPLQVLAPVIELSHQPIVVAVHPSLGVTTLAQLTELVKKQPGMGFATGSGAGSTQAMLALWYAKLAGIKLEQVAYRGGGQAINDLVAGHVKLGSLGTTPLIPYSKTGGLILLAQSMATRSPALPSVPTFRESGLMDLVMDQRIGIFVPSATPASIVTRLNGELNTVLRDENVRKIFIDQAQDPAGGTAEQFSIQVHQDSEKYKRLSNELNVKVE